MRFIAFFQVGLLLIATSGLHASELALARNDAKAEKITGCLLPPVLVKGEPRVCKTLEARMAELKVPGASIAVIHHGVIVWAKGFGLREPGGAPVTPDTLFQAGSISKPVAALAALRLVQTGKLSLDQDINKTLTSWHLPSGITGPNSVATLRELLTHTSGINVHGFPGYAHGKGVPTLIEVLDGSTPANTPPIRIVKAPGGEWDYSGGGFTVMQQALIDTTHESFPALLKTSVLIPLGMKHSTYEQPLPAPLLRNAATPYGASGPIIGGAHTYPEMAAAGLWTTPSDLAKYVIEVQRSARGESHRVLNKEMAKAMLTPTKGHWGLGVELGASDVNPYFTHGGVNEGFQSLFVAYENSGDGAIVMTNSTAGMELASDVIRSIAMEYDWPDFQPPLRTTVTVARSLLDRYVGTYVASPTFSVTYTLEGDQLFTQASGQKKFPIFPETDSRFFLKVVDGEIDFHTDDNGKVDYLLLHQNGHDYKEVKK